MQAEQETDHGSNTNTCVTWHYCYSPDARIAFDSEPLFRLPEEPEGDAQVDEGEECGGEGSSEDLVESAAGGRGATSGEKGISGGGNQKDGELVSGRTGCEESVGERTARGQEPATDMPRAAGEGFGARTEQFFMALGALEGADLTHCGTFREVQRVYKRVREMAQAARREARARERDRAEGEPAYVATIASIEERNAVLAKAALGTVMENERFGRRLLNFCRHAVLLRLQPA